MPTTALANGFSVRTYPVPPPSFDLDKATDRERAICGIPRPPVAFSDLAKRWEAKVGQFRIVEPIFEPRTLRRKRLPGFRPGYGPETSTIWSGGIVFPSSADRIKWVEGEGLDYADRLAIDRRPQRNFTHRLDLDRNRRRRRLRRRIAGRLRCRRGATGRRQHQASVQSVVGMVSGRFVLDQDDDCVARRRADLSHLRTSRIDHRCVDFSGQRHDQGGMLFSQRQLRPG